MRFKPVKVLLVFLVALFVMLGVYGAVLAQDDPMVTNTPAPVLVTLAPEQPPVDAPSPIEAIPVEDAAHDLLGAVYAIIGTAISAPATLFIVGVLKTIPLLNSISARTLQVVVAGVLVCGVWIARYFGVAVQFDSLLNAIQVAGPVIFQLVLTLSASHAAYEYASARDIAIIGYERPIFSGKQLHKSAYQSGQGLVEYALILVLVAVVVIVILALLGPAIGNVFSQIVNAIDPNALAPASGG